VRRYRAYPKVVKCRRGYSYHSARCNRRSCRQKRWRYFYYRRGCNCFRSYKRRPSRICCKQHFKLCL